MPEPYKALVPEAQADLVVALACAIEGAQTTVGHERRISPRRTAQIALPVIEAAFAELTAPLVAELEEVRAELRAIVQRYGRGFVTPSMREVCDRLTALTPEPTDKEGGDGTKTIADLTPEERREFEEWMAAKASEGSGVASELATDDDRKAAVRLAICDALLWTNPDELRGSESMTALREGVQLLDHDELPESLEERFLEGLLETGWNLAPAADQSSPGTSGDDKEGSE